MATKRRPKMQDWEAEKRMHDKLLNSLKEHFEEDEMEMRRDNQNNPDKRESFRELMKEMLEMERGDDDDMEEDEEEEYEDSEGEEEDSAPMCPFASEDDEEEEDEEDEEESVLPKDKRKQLAILVMSKRAGKKAM